MPAFAGMTELGLCRWRDDAWPYVVVIVVAGAVFGVDRAMVALERRGLVRWRATGRTRGGGAGAGAFGELMDAFQPSRRIVAEERARQRLRVDQAESGAAGPDVDLDAGRITLRAPAAPDAAALPAAQDDPRADLEVLFAGVRSPLFLHAHPDDETLSTGALIAALAASGRRCLVLTATRGERGEVRPGALPEGVPLVEHREAEWRRACHALGVAEARLLGAPRHLYSDSGMVWVDAAETLAGPAPDAPADALSAAAPADLTAAIAADIGRRGADAVITYDALGGYGHPDHVALNGPGRAAAAGAGLPFLEVASQPRGVRDAEASGVVWLDLSAQLPTVARALGAYASQLRVDGADVVHVGGQREPIQLRIGLRRA